MPAADLFRASYRNTCKSHSIKGENVKKEVALLIEKLPQIFNGIIKTIKENEFVEAVSYYYIFIRFISPDSQDSKLEIIDYLIKEDNNLIKVFDKILP